METPYRPEDAKAAAAGATGGIPTPRQNASNAVDSGRRAAVKGFQNTSRVLRSTADRLPETSRARDVVDGAADMFDSTAGYLRDRQASDMLEDVRSQARENPVAFLFGVLAVGFWAGWMLRRH